MVVTAVFVAAVFLLAGMVKGAVGLGLPPIAMGLLVLVMAPVEAAALLVIPSVLTNVWQMLSGRHLAALVRRLWPLLVCAAAGTLLGIGWLSDETAPIGTAILGAILAVYALTSLIALQPTVRPPTQRWMGPVAGGTTGLITAATGISAVPAVPYLQAIGLEKDALVQAMGLSFTVSTVALAVNLIAVDALTWSAGPMVAVALAAVFAGIWLGQRLRGRMDPQAFRRWFLVGLLLLGVYQMARAVV